MLFVTSIHDDSVPGVVPDAKYIRPYTRYGILTLDVDHISAGRSISTEYMSRLLRLLQGETYQQNWIQDASDLIRRMADSNVDLIPMTIGFKSEYNQPSIIEVHINTMSPSIDRGGERTSIDPTDPLRCIIDIPIMSSPPPKCECLLVSLQR